MPQKVIVFHRYYGCATGCCGHSVVLVDPEEFEKHGFDPEYDDRTDRESNRNFQFDHPFDETEEGKKEFAKQMVERTFGEEHVKDLDWDHCIFTDCEFM